MSRVFITDSHFLQLNLVQHNSLTLLSNDVTFYSRKNTFSVKYNIS